MVEAKREIDLLSYLPRFLREYDETKAALEAENPEFRILWEQSAGALDNSFILTAEEWGIKRFEKLLGIFPAPKQGLEARRETVLVRWLSRLPYTYRMLLRELNIVCGENFEVSKSFDDDYYLQVVTHVRDWTKTPEIKRLINKMVPANIRTEHYNSILIKAEKSPRVYCGADAYKKRKKITVCVKKPK